MDNIRNDIKFRNIMKNKKSMFGSFVKFDVQVQRNLPPVILNAFTCELIRDPRYFYLQSGTNSHHNVKYTCRGN